MSARKKRKSAEGYEPHTFSIWVDTLRADGTITSNVAYFGSSKFSARQKFAQAILDNPEASRVEMRVDGNTTVRVVVEHPSNWPWQQEQRHTQP